MRVSKVVLTLPLQIHIITYNNNWAGRKTLVQPTTAGKLSRHFLFMEP